MAAIILPHRWNRQPTAPCGVNKHSELARGLTHLISGAGWSAVPEYPVRVTGAAHTIKPIRGGLGFVHQALGSGFYCDADAAQINAARSWTMAIVGEIPADVSSTATFAYHSTVAANTGSWDRTIQAGYSGGYFYTSGFLYSGATYSVNGTIPLDFNAGTAAFTYVLTAGNGFLKGFTNGRADGSTAIPGNGFTGYGPCYLNFAHLGGVHRLLSLAKIDGLAWDEARALEFHRNPWQLFAPLRRRLYIPSAGVAAVTGNAALVEANDTLSAAVSVTVSASAALQEANDSLTAAAATAVSASAALLEANDTLVSLSVVAVTGTATIQEAADTLASGGTVTFPGVIGTAALAEANDALTSAVSVVLNGTAALSEANDALTSTGAVSITASASLLEANDTLAAEGGTATFAIAAMTERDDALTATGTVLVTGAAAISEASDVLVSAATVSITATAALQEANDLLTAAGSVGTVVRTADAALQEANDTLAATVASTVSASAAIIEAGDIVVSGVTVLVTANAALVEANDGLTAAGTALFGAFADAALQEANDTLTSAVVQKIARRIAASDALRGGIAASDAGRWTITSSDGLN